jgi:hypothetical protein
MWIFWLLFLIFDIAIISITLFHEFKWASQDGRRAFHDKFGNANYDSGFLGIFALIILVAIFLLFR